MPIINNSDGHQSARLIGGDADEARRAGMDLDRGAASLCIAIEHGSPVEDLVIVEAMPNTVMYAVLIANAARYGLDGKLTAEELAAMRDDLRSSNGNLSAISSREWLQEVFERAGVAELAEDFRNLPKGKNLFPLVFDMGETLYIGSAELVHMN